MAIFLSHVQVTTAKLTPCNGQTEASIKEWMKSHVRVGGTVAVRNSYAGRIRYSLSKVVKIGRERFEIDTLGPLDLRPAGKTFYFSGKNCWCPHGHVRLVIPTAEVKAAAAEGVEMPLRECELTV